MTRRILIGIVLASLTGGVAAEDLVYKDRALKNLIAQVPDLLKDYDAQTGHFGKGIWICRDQDRIYPLAVAYASKTPGNKYYKDPALLETIMKAGDALIADADENGQWVFRKKDGSTWGNISMPWTYSRWIRCYALIRDDMPAERRQKWVQAFELGYGHIIKTQLKHVHNIPTHHAMGLYIAGQALNKPEWCEIAGDFMMKVIGTQSEGGYFSEGGGPVVTYNFVYIDALGTYYAASRDERVLPALAKASLFHRHFTYPGGQNVETVDQRNPFRDGVNFANIGFSFTPAGRAYLHTQWERYGVDKFPADMNALLVLYGQEGLMEAPSVGGKSDLFVLNEGGVDRAAVLSRADWFVCLSAYVTPILDNRWIQDRQNFVSIYHEKVGLILGGGNTKLQPSWSSFAVGDPTLLKHTPGDTKPNFLPPEGKLFHVPSEARLVREPGLGLDFVYGPAKCQARVRVVDAKTLVYRVSTDAAGDLPVVAHLTLLPHFKKTLETAAGRKMTVGEEPFRLSSDELGGGLTYAGYRLRLPKSADLYWPALPHNPYRKDGRAEADEGRLVVRLPLDAKQLSCEVTVEILD